ncbi:hypothetical protein GCM10022239_09610 [Leifsonia bigeumensis]|uniref:Uncharacterized protein n=1 Tax=Leifsonella bigeumensis TaxID=433643 RepID=A0ABP7FEJ8_9MICO
MARRAIFRSMASFWQHSVEYWQSCHSWQYRSRHRFTAMILLALIAALAAAGFAATVVVASRDGYRRIPTRPR